MPKAMHVVPESMQTGGSDLTAIAQQLATGLSGLQNTIAGDGNPWGADEQGSIFGQLYQVILGKAFQAIVSHVDQVGYAGQALAAQARTYGDVEADLTTGFTAAATQSAG